MAHSLSPECTPLKKEYDNCFNAWFEGYLEPAVAVPEGERAAHSKRKAEEFQQQCGKIWEGYRGCIHNALKEKGLDKMLDQARQENPLTEPSTSATKPSP